MQTYIHIEIHTYVSLKDKRHLNMIILIKNSLSVNFIHLPNSENLSTDMGTFNTKL